MMEKISENRTILMEEAGLNLSRRMGSLATISTFHCVDKQNNQDFMEGP